MKWTFKLWDDIIIVVGNWDSWEDESVLACPGLLSFSSDGLLVLIRHFLSCEESHAITDTLRWHIKGKEPPWECIPVVTLSFQLTFIASKAAMEAIWDTFPHSLTLFLWERIMKIKERRPFMRVISLFSFTSLSATAFPSGNLFPLSERKTSSPFAKCLPLLCGFLYFWRQMTSAPSLPHSHPLIDCLI